METIHMLAAHANYVAFILLMCIGLFALMTKQNLIKKLIALSIFQTAIILFYVSTAAKTGATIPIAQHHSSGHSTEQVEAAHGAHHAHNTEAINAEDYHNPLPHVLMLTAIVVGVATLGVGLALTQRIYAGYGTLEENELLLKLASDDRKTT